MIPLAIVETDANHLVTPVGKHHVEERHAAVESKLAVMRRDQTRLQLEITLGIVHAADDAVEHGRIGDTVFQVRIGAEEELHVACAVARANRERLVGDAVEVAGVADCAADEVVDLQEGREIGEVEQVRHVVKLRQRDAVLLGEVDDGRRGHRAFEVQVELGLG